MKHDVNRLNLFERKITFKLCQIFFKFILPPFSKPTNMNIIKYYKIVKPYIENTIHFNSFQYIVKLEFLRRILEVMGVISSTLQTPKDKRLSTLYCPTLESYDVL